MIHVTVTKQGNYPVSAKKIKDIVTKTFIDNGIVSSAEASVALVNAAHMKELVDKYYDDKEKHVVLSFPSSEVEGQFIFPEDGLLHLGEIVISYPDCVEEAKSKNKLIEEIVCGYAEHAALHLIGIHHD